MARAWRAGSKARAAKLGCVNITLPSIDEVEAHLRAQPLRCLYCDRRLTATGAGKPQMDHKQSLSRGGTAGTDNLGLCCKACNSAKGPLNSDEYLSLLSFLSTWEDQDAAKSLLSRLRGAYWCYRGSPKGLKQQETASCCHQHRVQNCLWCRVTGGDGFLQTLYNNVPETE
jgi:hypothetical protein